VILSYIGEVLGWVMYWCYNLLNDYGAAIILFTFLTKIIILPISIMVQKNSIKIVKMQPQLNYINVEMWGNKERISEEQIKLYKKEKYNPLMGLIPLFLQIFLLMGVIDVMYKPLRHVLRLENSVISELVSKYSNFSGKSSEIGSIQVHVVEAIQEGLYLDNFTKLFGEDLINQILNLRMKFLSFNLGIIPAESLGKYIFIPILAAVSALLLCLVQNKINVLQSEQGKRNKIFTMLFSVGISLYLGFLVPSGVGFYWMFSNLFAILQLIFLNKIINPKKFINYQELDDSKKELEKVRKYAQPIRKWYEKDPYRNREKADNKRFFKIEEKLLVFYSAKSGFYKYFKGIIEVILQESDIIIHYVTSDPNDTIFEKQSDRIEAYYIGDVKLITFMMKMDADIVVMTMPDLEKYQIKRSYVKKDIEYIYLHHAINSINLTLRTGALDYFDTIFAHSTYCVEEIRQIEKLHQTKEKTIVEYGYSLLDELIEDYSNVKIENEKKVILIAPSWQKDNILDSCVEDILNGLIGQGYKIIIRPHPQYFRYSIGQIDYLQEKYCSENNEVVIERDFSSNETIYNSDILITDWSSISYEYSFSTLKPTLYINTPMKVMNPQYKDIECEPYDILVRSKIGKELNLDELDKCLETVQDFLENKDAYTEQLKRLREENIFNIGGSAKIGASYIIKRLNEIKEEKMKKEEWER